MMAPNENCYGCFNEFDCYGFFNEFSFFVDVLNIDILTVVVVLVLIIRVTKDYELWGPRINQRFL